MLQLLRRRQIKWLPLLVLTALSVALHWLVTDQVGRSLPGSGEGDGGEGGIKRMEAAYVKELKLSAPPVAARPPAPAPAPGPKGKARRKPKPVEDAASKPEEDKLALTPPEAPASSPSAPQEPASKPVDQAVAKAPEPPASAASAPSKAPVFEWPKATKVSFKLEGYFRGKVSGSAEVEWLRNGNRYQVHLDTVVGAGMITQYATSEGEITPDGLFPLRNETKGRRMFTDIPLKTLEMGAEEITFPNGDKTPRPAGVQDLISNIIQLSYRFTLDPTLLTPGRTIQVKVATAKQLEDVAFDVINEEVIDSPMGPLPAVHVKPRRLIETGTPLPPVEVWFAPNLQYLPVRIYAERTDGPRDKQFNVNMEMVRPPQQVGANE